MPDLRDVERWLGRARSVKRGVNTAQAVTNTVDVVASAVDLGCSTPLFLRDIAHLGQESNDFLNDWIDRDDGADWEAPPPGMETAGPYDGFDVPGYDYVAAWRIQD